MKPTLYFAPGTCARVALTALEEIGQPFETKVIAFRAGEHRSAEYLSINPSGKVPALDTGAGVVTQNGAILLYLARSHPEAKLLPIASEPLEEAATLSMLLRFSSDLHPLVTRHVLPFVILGGEGPLQQVRDTARQVLTDQLAPFEQKLRGGEWVMGDRWSVLDAYLAWVWFRITGTGFDPAVFPAIADHYDRASERPSAKAAIMREQSANDELASRGLAFEPPKIAR